MANNPWCFYGGRGEETSNVAGVGDSDAYYMKRMPDGTRVRTRRLVHTPAQVALWKAAEKDRKAARNKKIAIGVGVAALVAKIFFF